MKHRHLIAYLSPPVISRVYKLKWQRTERRPAARVSPTASRASLGGIGMPIIMRVCVTRADTRARAPAGRPAAARGHSSTLSGLPRSRAHVCRAAEPGGRSASARGPVCGP